ncbi:MAG: 3-dehydroquinate synthase [Gammaproteobacteria bacterium]|nr:3-dehydroquinate synthase [Gammaproteobacteria bacterium]MCH9715856.1 3-dehydroquinate synthase [Gammaproteobacteria bacterium]MCH9763354.1 3-dehydroquinate synthase [Gammaproteobacteria bacterium]
MEQPMYFEPVLSSETLIQMCQATTGRIVIVTDEHVAAHHAQPLLHHLTSHAIKAELITIPPGERSKSREVKHHIEDKMLSIGCNRDTLMIALGGGMITDLTGFIAATYCRGIPVIYIPTSLLAMVDASNGGKTGINTDYGKNLIGTFTHPHAVFIDVNYLTTLPSHEYLHAFSEIIKHALIYDAEYFSVLESSIDDIQQKNKATLLSIIKQSCEIKSAIVLSDPKETAQREMLNFGHTIAHALEISSQYALSHGEAVAIGILVESYLSHQLNLLSDTDFERIKQLILNLNQPSIYQCTFSKKDIIKAFNLDKKTKQNKPRFVLLSAIGTVFNANNAYAHTVDPALLDQAIDYLFEHHIR